MTISEIVKKLIGSIDPIGETNQDEVRFENLKDLILLVDILISDINRVAMNKGRVEYSMNKAGERASKFLDDLGIKP